jgi:D-glycero-D-manno-heptose 1,7-bisphosphate phosphatase
LPLNTVPFIGDTKHDVDAAKAAKANPVLVRTGKGQRTAASYPELLEFPWFNDLSDAVDNLLEGNLRT